MNHKEWFHIKSPNPVCTGTGLVALDVVINGKPKSLPRLWAGGSCGNVLTILSYLGWDSYPIARLGDDLAAEEIVKDMERWEVKTSLISRSSTGSTPIIVEKIKISRSGTPLHRFEWTCPNCGSWLPRCKLVLAKDVEQIKKNVPKSQVFYFDRASRSAIILAVSIKSQGGLIFFEPSGIREKKLFIECLQVSDIVKYSHERLGHVKDLIEGISIPLEIETLGEEGLRYRFGITDRRNRKCRVMSACPVKTSKDAAGAGDWCSAGIIHLLGSAGRVGLENLRTRDVETALNFGQTLAALNCYYEGARGSMYKLSKQKFEMMIHDIWRGASPPESIEEIINQDASHVFKCICPSCKRKTMVSDTENNKNFFLA